MKKLSIIIPVYNEEMVTVESIRRILKTPVRGLTKELIIINDGSTDKTATKLKQIKDRRCLIINHRANLGKGAAIRTALKVMTGDMAVIQDADLEYDPADLDVLLAPILAGKADVVFGSRFLGGNPHRVLYFWHRVANFIITTICDMTTNLNLTDVETGYKAFTRDVAKKLKLSENRFNFDPEFTVRVARMGCRIYEVGISYAGRSYANGKKISWRDGVLAIWAIIKYSLIKQ